MAKKMLKFADGGSDRYKARMDRKTADIEKDYKIALAKGKNADVAKAKYEQRKADAADDFAKYTKADRTGTRAAESAAEAALKEARRTKGRSIQMRDSLEKNNKPLEIKSTTDSILKGVNTTPLAKKAAAPAAKAPARSGTGSSTRSSTPKGPDVNARTKEFFSKLPLLATRDFTSVQNKPTGSSITKSPARDNSAAGRRARMGEVFSGLNPFRNKSLGDTVMPGLSTEAEKRRKASGQNAPRKLLLVGDEAREANRRQGTIGGKAKGGNVKKYAGGGSIPPQPTAAERAESRKQDESLKKAKVSTKEGRVISSANRSEGTMKKAKGGFMASKFGKALVKKSADTKGRAMMKKAGGGSCYAKGGSIDGCAVKGKTKATMVKMNRGGKTC